MMRDLLWKWNMTDEEIVVAVINLRREIETARFLMPLERKDFGPTQVRSVADLVPGRTYVKHYNGFDEEFVFHGVTAAGQLDWTNTRFGRRSDAHFPSDCNLAPYTYGNWNPSNWIEDPSRR